MSDARAAATIDLFPEDSGSVIPPESLVVLSSEATGDMDSSTSVPDVVPELRHERFQIGTKLGEGGMGVVYRARDSRDGREVALKLMKGTITGTARRRFEREFRSLSALTHPHCLGVYDYGELGGGPFFTMELFLGQPITSLSSKPLAERLDGLLQVTLALDYIHGHGIVHRDVKPTNILVRAAMRDDGSRHFETRLMDFGLAKYYGVKSSLSAEAGFVGTVAYCAPEQINLDELDHRADLYCLGLVAYEVLSGRYAFPEARLGGMRPLMQAQLNDKPKPLVEVNPELPASIADAVMKYLRKQPRRRPDCAGLLRSAIAGFLGVDDKTSVSGVAIPVHAPGCRSPASSAALERKSRSTTSCAAASGPARVRPATRSRPRWSLSAASPESARAAWFRRPNASRAGTGARSMKGGVSTAIRLLFSHSLRSSDNLSPN